MSYLRQVSLPMQKNAEHVYKAKEWEMNDKTPQDYAAFLESLKVNNDGPSVGHNPDFDWVDTASNLMIGQWLNQPYTLAESYRVIERLNRRVRIAELNAKPSNLAEQVKAFMRAGMNAQLSYCNDKEMPSDSMSQKARKICEQYLEFRRLSEPGEK